MNQDYQVYFGRLGRNPELRRTQAGDYIADFSLAVNSAKEKPVLWLRIVVWEDLAKECSKRLKKGSEVFIRGRESLKSFQDRKGETKEYKEVSAHFVGFTHA